MTLQDCATNRFNLIENKISNTIKTIFMARSNTSHRKRSSTMKGGKCHKCGKYVSGPKKGKRYSKHCSSTGKYKRTSKNKSLKRVGKYYKSSKKSSPCKRRKTRSDKGRTHRRRSKTPTKRRKTRSDKGRTHRRKSKTPTKRRKTRSDKGRTHRRRSKTPTKRRKTRSDKGKKRTKKTQSNSMELAEYLIQKTPKTHESPKTPQTSTPQIPKTPESPATPSVLDSIKNFFTGESNLLEWKNDKKDESQRLSFPKRPSGPKGRRRPSKEVNKTPEIESITQSPVDSQVNSPESPRLYDRASDIINNLFSSEEDKQSSEEPWLKESECPDPDYPVRCDNKNWCVPQWWNEKEDDVKYRSDEFCHRTNMDILQRMGSTDELKKLYANQRKKGTATKKPKTKTAKK